MPHYNFKALRLLSSKTTRKKTTHPHTFTVHIYFCLYRTRVAVTSLINTCRGTVDIKTTIDGNTLIKGETEHMRHYKRLCVHLGMC